MNSTADFNKPTAIEMAKFFHALPQNKPFIIIDPDTGWVIDTFSIEVRDDVAELTAEYVDMSGFAHR